MLYCRTGKYIKTFLQQRPCSSSLGTKGCQERNGAQVSCSHFHKALAALSLFCGCLIPMTSPDTIICQLFSGTLHKQKQFRVSVVFVVVVAFADIITIYRESSHKSFAATAWQMTTLRRKNSKALIRLLNEKITLSWARVIAIYLRINKFSIAANCIHSLSTCSSWCPCNNRAK